MKANEAPEKIILSADRDTQIIYDDWATHDYTDNIKIEYTRTDAFIEKAFKWMRSDDVVNNEWNTEEDMYEDFKNYMKGD